MNPAHASDRRTRVLVVTGSRAEFGLLRPVMHAIAAHPALELRTCVAGSHLLPPAFTAREVEAAFAVHALVPMQEAHPHPQHPPFSSGADVPERFHDASALARGVSGFARALADLRPDITLVLGDRIEAFAAAAASSVAGVPVAHLHAGDRAEGIADEAMRHAITKLAHLHLPASNASAQRVARLGEDHWRIHLVGSPALDDLPAMPPLTDAQLAELGSPDSVLLFHPLDRHEHDYDTPRAAIDAMLSRGLRPLLLDPNHDPGRRRVLEALDAGARAGLPRRAHLPRPQFVGLLRRARVLVGNSSAGLIEAPALGCPAVDIPPRQDGRERPEGCVRAHASASSRPASSASSSSPPSLSSHDPSQSRAPAVADLSEPAFSPTDIARALDRALALARGPFVTPFGDAHAGRRTAELLACLNVPRARLLRKQNTF